jgi:hypothetical protein
VLKSWFRSLASSLWTVLRSAEDTTIRKAALAKVLRKVGVGTCYCTTDGGRPLMSTSPIRGEATVELQRRESVENAIEYWRVCDTEVFTQRIIPRQMGRAGWNRAAHYAARVRWRASRQHGRVQDDALDKCKEVHPDAIPFDHPCRHSMPEAFCSG